MYLRRAILKNIKGFSDLDFGFERPGDGHSNAYAGWSVVLGDNASGKSTLLKALSLAIVGPDNARILQPSAAGWIREGENSATIALQLVAGPQDRFGQGRRYEQPFWAELQLTLRSNGIVSIGPGKQYIRKSKGPSGGPWADAPEGWYAVGYGPFRRLYGHSPEAQRLMSTPGAVARFATMFREDATLAEGDLWLKELSHRSLEGHESDGELLDRTLAVLNHNFLQNDIRIDRVDSEGLWLRQPNGSELPLQDMSDGYRAAIAMIVDMIRQLVDVYGPTALVEVSPTTPIISHNGIVFIDEVDAHLHPSWQREIGEWFKRIFPNIQFIVTTHSPFICQAADAHGLFALPPPGQDLEPHQVDEEDRLRIIASRPNEIYLSPAFNMRHTYSPRAVRARQRHAELRAKQRAVGLTVEEQREDRQLNLFVTSDQDHD